MSSSPWGAWSIFSSAVSPGLEQRPAWSRAPGQCQLIRSEYTARCCSSYSYRAHHTGPEVRLLAASATWNAREPKRAGLAEMHVARAVSAGSSSCVHKQAIPPHPHQTSGAPLPDSFSRARDLDACTPCLAPPHGHDTLPTHSHRQDPTAQGATRGVYCHPLDRWET